MIIYKITIQQKCSDIYHCEWSELYEDANALKKAFEEMNSEAMFGDIVKENISPDWETDCFSEVIRKRGNWETRIATVRVRPRKFYDVKMSGAFPWERSQCLLKMF